MCTGFFFQYVIILIILIKTMWVCIVHYTLHPSHVTERFCMCSGNFYRALDLAQWLHHGGHCSYTAFVVPNHLVGFHSNDRCFPSEVWNLHLKRRRGGRLQNTKTVCAGFYPERGHCNSGGFHSIMYSEIIPPGTSESGKETWKAMLF